MLLSRCLRREKERVGWMGPWLGFMAGPIAGEGKEGKRLFPGSSSSDPPLMKQKGGLGNKRKGKGVLLCLHSFFCRSGNAVCGRSVGALSGRCKFLSRCPIRFQIPPVKNIRTRVTRQCIWPEYGGKNSIDRNSDFAIPILIFTFELLFFCKHIKIVRNYVGCLFCLVVLH